MAGWARVISTIGPMRIITAIGSLLIILGAGRSILLVTAGVPLLAALDGFLLIGGPGLGLLYGRYWLSQSDIHLDLYPNIAAWCLGGVGALLVVLGLIELDPTGGVDRPLFTSLIAVAIGSAGGFLIGVHEAGAVSQSREADEHRDEFRAERDLREHIVDTNPIGIVIVNADRSISLTNQRTAEIVGLPQEAILELEYNESMLETTDAEGKPLEMGVFQQVLTSGEAVYDAERQMTRPDGQQIWLSVNGAPLRDQSGAVAAVIFAIQDISERKQLESELTNTVAQLEQSNNRLQQFAHIASHDLQEPLRMVSSYLQLLESRYNADLDTEAREFIEFAVDGADRMREMIQDLLAYSRLQQHDHTYEPVDCNAVVDHVLADLHVQIEENHAEVITEPLPTIHADGTQIEQLFQNLVSNALKYNESEAPRVEIAAKREHEQWVFSVADNGIGIDPKRTKRIFEVFNRLHSDDEYPGTGIGLSLCQEVVNQHGGTIWVDSRQGDGSTFYFTIPDTKEEDSQSISQAT